MQRHPKDCPIPNSCPARKCNVPDGDEMVPHWYCQKCGGVLEVFLEQVTEPSHTIAGDILREATRIVDGTRNTTHGDKEHSFIAIAAMWQAYLFNRKNQDGPIRPYDVSQMMVLLKMCRAEWGEPIRDHFIDQCGYSAITGELNEKHK